MYWKSILQRQQEWSRENSDSLRLSVEEATELYESAPPVSYTHLTLPTNREV